MRMIMRISSRSRSRSHEENHAIMPKRRIIPRTNSHHVQRCCQTGTVGTSNSISTSEPSGSLAVCFCFIREDYHEAIEQAR